MNACATVDAVAKAGLVDELSPIVLVDLVVEPRLGVSRFEADWPLDERRVTLRLNAPPDERAALMRRLLRARGVTVIWPARLEDERPRPIVMAEGRLRSAQTNREVGRDDALVELIDDWAWVLSEPLETIWREVDGVAVPQRADECLKVGADANRSVGQHAIHERFVHVPTVRGKPWTVATALATVLAMANLEVSLLLLPEEVAAAPLVDEIDLGRPVGDVLKRIVTPYDLVVERLLALRGGRVVELRAVRGAQDGRAVTIGWPGQGASALSIEAQGDEAGARLWEATAPGWRVESTFELSPGWDPGLESVSDAELDRSTSDDFAAVANVFRLWVLNEDGRFSEAPFSVPRYDAATLFGLDVVEPRALRFLPCVTLDDSGDARAVMLEVSLDSGVNWSTYAGRWINRPDRAAVYLDDSALDSAFLTAARSGAARLRVTGSLQSPVANTVRRWRGNAFMGQAPANVIDTGQAFTFRRVDAASIHYEAVRDGSLLAAEADDGAALERYLVERMREASRGGSQHGRARLTVSGAWPMARIGDRVMHAGGSGLNARGESEAVDGRGGIVRGVKVRWDRPGARSTKAAPVTELALNI